jgi:hypothetical protein
MGGTRSVCSVLGTGLLLVVLGSSAATGQQTTAFTYQGQLTDAGTPANGSYDLRCALFDSVAGGTQIGSTQTVPTVSASSGIFTVQLDFGVNAFPGANRFLEIGVKPAGVGSFTTLAPRQQITSTPYAIRSATSAAAETAANATSAATATNATQLGGVAANQYVRTNDSRLSDARPPTAGSSSYIRNAQTTQQTGDFNITGSGNVGGNLSTVNFFAFGNAEVNNLTTQSLKVQGVTSLGAPGSVYGYLVDAGSPGPYPTLGFNTYGPSYLAGVSGYGGVLQFQDGDGSLSYYTGSSVSAGAPHTNNPTPRFAIGQNGNVGVGTTPSTARLTVRGRDTSDSTSAFLVGNANDESGLTVWNDRTVQIGAIKGGGYIHACYFDSYFFANCSAAAEYVPTIDNGAGFAQAADLVSLAPSVKNPYGDEHSPFVVTRAAKPCDDNLSGVIVNPESGADGEKLNDHYLPLAIYGYFPAKVTMENGAIKRGDPITSSSKPGYGMKATQACKIVGYALEDAAQEGKIQVSAHLSEYTAPHVAALQAQVRQLRREKSTQMEALKTQNARLEARLAALERAVQRTGQDSSLATPQRSISSASSVGTTHRSRRSASGPSRSNTSRLTSAF